MHHVGPASRRVGRGWGMAVSEDVGASGVDGIDGILWGTRWSGGRVTWSLPDSPGDYAADHQEPLNDFSPLNAAQITAARATLEAEGPGRGFSVEGFTNLRTDYLGFGSGKGKITLANTSDPGTAYGYYPGETPEGGDVFIGGTNRTPKAGNLDWLTVQHELGHALGLKHGHEASGFGALPDDVMGMEYSIMPYRSYVGSNGFRNETWGFAQSFMMLDIAALQELYGADYSTNSGDTTYSWTPGAGTTFVNGKAAISPGANRVFLTIWDGGGEDTYDMSAYRTAVEIDLRPSNSSLLSETQRADLGDGHLARNVYNAMLYKGNTASLIENATGGSAGDVLRGNDGANLLRGNGGNDRLSGNAGADYLVGGSGRDSLHGGSGADTLLGGAGADKLVGGGGADIFRFHAGSSTPAAADGIRAGGGAIAFQGAGTAGGDRIDLRPIDADTGRDGNQTFKWGGQSQKGTGHVWLANEGSNTAIRANTDTDAAAEFKLLIADGTGISAGDYTAGDFLL